MSDPLLPVADAILRDVAAQQALYIDPTLPVGWVTIPERIVAELGLPPHLLDLVAQLWESAVRHALADTLFCARDLASVAPRHVPVAGTAEV